MGNADTTLLETRGLGKFFGGLKALQDVDLVVRRGHIHGLIGPNGSGKTTMLNVLSGVLRPNEGQILFAEKDIAGLPPHRVTQVGIGRTFQNLRLFKRLSVLDNVLLGGHRHLGYGITKVLLQRHRKAEREAVERAQSLLEYVGISHRRDDLAGSLPYGEQRLVEIARALATDPTFLLLDEPLAGMNSTEINHGIEVLHRVIAEGRTILLVEHTMRVVMSICDVITVLNYGRKIAEGTPVEVRENSEVIVAYLGGRKQGETANGAVGV